MASLVEELVIVLEEEAKIYQTLLEYGEKKRRIVIQANIPALEELTSLEQIAGDELLACSNKQVRILQDIATVIGKNDQKMTVTRLIGLMASQPEVQTQLMEIRDRLVTIAEKVQHLNQQNEVLLQQAIEMAEFDITLFKSMRQAPETANYDSSACNTGSLLGSSGFDARQ